MFRKLGVATALALLVVLLFVQSVSAIANPVAIGIGDVCVFDDVLETGDVLVYMRYDINYASEPTEDADDAFLMAIYDVDGTTLLASRPVNYYQHNIISIYLSAADNMLTVGAPYYVRVMGSPALFTLVENVNMDTRVLAAGDYWEAVDLGGIMITQAGILEDAWVADLLTATDKLNTTGAFYFTEAIPALTSMASDIFSTATSSFTYERSNFTESGLNETLKNMPVSLNEATTGMDNMLGISNHKFGQFGWLLIMGMMVGGVVYGATNRPDVALLGGVIAPLGLFAYLGASEGDMMRFFLTIGVIVIVWFAVEFFIPRYG